MNERKEQSTEHRVVEKNRRILWWILAAAMAWGLMIGVGAFIHDYRRGLMVFGVVLVLGAFWALLQRSFERRQVEKK